MTPASDGLGPLLLKGVQIYAWAVFLVAWAQMGWIDWKEQKIRNRYLRLWVWFIAGGYAALLLQSALGAFGVAQVFIMRDYYVALGWHLAVSAAAAYALWWLRIWPAGDVKLFCLLALCYPLMRIPGSFRSGLLFLEVLINIFVPAAAFLFVTAGEYLWRTRLAVYKDHVKVRVSQAASDFRYEVGRRAYEGRERSARVRARWLSRGAAAGAAATRGLSAAWSKTLELWKPVAGDLKATAAFYRANPRRLALDAFTWFSMMAIMSMVSYSLNDLFSSQILKTVLCFALMFGWSRVCTHIGQTASLGVLLAGCLAVMWHSRHVNVDALAVIFGHITVFSLCIWFGVQIAVKMLAGDAGYAALPVLMMLPGLIPWRMIFRGVWSVTAAVAGLVWSTLARFLPGLVPAAPRLPSFAVHLALPGADVFASNGDGASLMLWAGMGLFFGLALVFVKIWDAESYKTIPVAHIDRFMNPGPALVERIEAEDPDFHEEHLASLYADGLTGDQAEALKEWCAEAGIESVPLAPTISFANWIFMGYLLTRVLEGHVLRFIY